MDKIKGPLIKGLIVLAVLVALMYFILMLTR